MNKILLTLTSILFCAITFAQNVPQGINYQAIARDAAGAELANDTLIVQFSVLNGAAISWQETHTVTTNDFGMFTAIIGGGTSTSNGSSSTFDLVDWGNAAHSLKVEIDYGNGYLDMGTTDFMSVPYSLHAKTAANGSTTDELQSLRLSGDTLFIEIQGSVNGGNWIILPTPILLGCTDSTAFNYNVLANTDDGSCIINGCTDSTAFNYNILANTDNGSCIPVVFGCTDSTQFNYDPLANTDNGSCIAFIYGCTDSTALNYNALANTDDGSCIVIGSTYQGGIVFYLDGNGGGLISASTDQGVAEWGCDATFVSAMATAIGTGSQNTINIVNANCSPYYPKAANICDTLTLGGYSDWFLPSKDELNAMYLNIGQGNALGLGNIGGFTGWAYYWSSTEYSNGTKAWSQNFLNGVQLRSIKNYQWVVRAVRAFGSMTVYGCTDINSTNYNLLANTDDGSCIAVVNGCTDSLYTEYDPLANTDDGTCATLIVNGCTDSTAFNYNALANTDDGSCIAVLNGCTDSLYTEYNPLANTDDGSCTTLIVNGCTDSTAYSGYNPLANTDDGSCIINGCTDSTAFNYNPLANIDDGSCIAVLNGCTDPTATNFNASATTDDGSCCLFDEVTLTMTDSYGDTWNGGTLTINGVTYDQPTTGPPGTGASDTYTLCVDLSTCIAVINFNGQWAFENSWSISDASGTVLASAGTGSGQFGICILGCTDPLYTEYDPLATVDDGSCTTLIVNGCTDSTALNYDTLANIDDGSCFFVVINGCTDSLYTEYDPLANTDDGSCSTLIVNGCTDPTAFNYNALANTDDGSCYTLIVNGCTDSTAYSGYNPLANIDDGSCIAVALGCTDSLYTEYNPLANTDDGTCATLIVNGCTDSTAFNYNLLANTDDGSCIAVVNGCTDSLYTEYNPLANTDDGSCTTLIVNGCTDSTAFNYNALANTDDGSCIAVALGCTDSTAFNYNALANTDDGSCIINGCTDSTAFNYNLLANTDDGSCIAVVNGCTDSLYTEYNPLANTDDGSCTTLIVNGCTDSTALNYDTLANIDDGSCFFVVINGCTDSLYTEYDPLANTDDGSCSTLIVNGCTDSTAFNYNALANTDDGSCASAIGDTYQGGIIFYIFQPGDIGYVAGQVHGLIAAPSNQSTNYGVWGGAKWGCYGTQISGADGIAIGTGAQNTIDIVNANCTGNTGGNSEAADICANLTLGGYSDWFLPSTDELNKMYLNLHQQGLGSFTNSFYWSSSKYNAWNAWALDFTDSTFYMAHRNVRYDIRAVRAF